MKKELHPEFYVITAHCACGAEFELGSTQSEMRVDICSNCHPFFTGKQRIVDTGGRVERFMRKYGTQYGGAEETGKSGENSA